jgi:hypothetical protein
MKLDEFNLWFDPIFNQLNDSIDTSKSITLEDGACGDFEGQLGALSDQVLDEKIINFYSFISDWKLHWKVDQTLAFKAEGVFNFIPFEQILNNGWDTDFGGNDWAPEMLGFRPLDMFYDIDGIVGFFVGREEMKGLFLFSDSELYPLHIDFDGYLKLLSMSKGFGWWQNALVQISSGKDQSGVDFFKEKMPLIFPEFSWDEFVKLYESVRIDNNQFLT